MSLQILRSNGSVVENSYIVKLKAHVDKFEHFEHIRTHIAPLEGLSEVTHSEWTSDCFHGYAGNFSGASLDALLAHEHVEYIEENGVEDAHTIVTQKNATWGLARISQTPKLSGNETALTFSYGYDSSAGKGVDVYVLDTGIYVEHHEFEGRASWGETFTGTPKVDKDGHGTHVAGIIAAKQFGVAKTAKLIAVKVLGDSGSGTKATSIDGMSWVKTKVKSSGHPSVVNISTGGEYSQAQNDTVKSLVDAGIHVIVAAGNENADADKLSPSSAPGAITVGSTTFQDERRSTSNYGKCVDLFAPGTKIISCGIANANATASKTGTSQATPFVAGLAAYFIGKDGNIKPADMTKKLKGYSLKGVLSGIPAGTENNLARNNIGL